jgi:uncharacterized protein (TIGR02271 family)
MQRGPCVMEWRSAGDLRGGRLAASVLKDIAMTGQCDGDPGQTDNEDRSAGEGTAGDATLRLLAEELAVAKEKVETGRVRISTRTHEHEALVDENLARERVEIETVPVGLRIDAVPEVRQEGDTTIIPVVEEILVVERRLILKEEIRIKRVRTIERHQEKVMVRRQEAVVTRYENHSSDGDTRPPADLGPTEPERE